MTEALDERLLLAGLAAVLTEAILVAAVEVAVEVDVRAASERLLHAVVVLACDLCIVVTVRTSWRVSSKLFASTTTESTIVFEVAVVRLESRLTLGHSVFT